MTDQTSPSMSRRRVLEGVGVSGVAAVGSTGVVAAQSTETGTGDAARLVVPEAEEFADDYLGLFVYVESQSTLELDAAELADCEFENPSPGDLRAFDGRLVDQAEGGPEDVPTRIYTTADSDVETGVLYFVEGASSCPGGYVGLEADRIGSAPLAEGTPGTGTATATDAGTEPDGTGYTVGVVIAEAEEFTDSYTGLFLQIQGRSTLELDAETVDGCESDDGWSPEALTAFDGRLVDRIEDDHKDIPAQVYAPADTGIDPRTLFVINRSFPCPEGYVGIEIEAIGSGIVRERKTGRKTVADEGGVPASGPGFGPLAAVAGVAGLAGLARYLSEDGGDQGD